MGHPNIKANNKTFGFAELKFAILHVGWREKTNIALTSFERQTI